MSIINLRRVLKKDGFEQEKGGKKRLFEVVELTFEQVKSIQMGVSSTTSSENGATDKMGICQIINRITPKRFRSDFSLLKGMGQMGADKEHFP